MLISSKMGFFSEGFDGSNFYSSSINARIAIKPLLRWHR